MHVEKQEKGQLDKFENDFDVAPRVQISNDTVQTNDSDQLEAAEKFELLCKLWFQENTCHGVKRNSREDVNPETALQVFYSDSFLVGYYFTVIANDGRSKDDDDIDEEKEVDDGVERSIFGGLSDLRLEGQLDR